MTTNLNRVNEINHPNPAKKDCIITLKDGFVFGNGKRQKAFSNINEAYEAVSKSKQKDTYGKPAVDPEIREPLVINKVPDVMGECAAIAKAKGDRLIAEVEEKVIESATSAPPKPKAKRKSKAKK